MDTRARIWIALLLNLRTGRSCVATAGLLSQEDAGDLADLAMEAGFSAGVSQTLNGTWRVTAKPGR